MLTACSAPADLSSSEDAVDRFHTQLNAQQFVTIYAESATELRTVTREAEFIGYLTPMSARLGKSMDSVMKSWKIHRRVASGTSVDMTYETTFEHGTAIEDFSFSMLGGKPLLAGYRIRSFAVVEKRHSVSLKTQADAAIHAPNLLESEERDGIWHVVSSIAPST